MNIEAIDIYRGKLNNGYKQLTTLDSTRNRHPGNVAGSNSLAVHVYTALSGVEQDDLEK